MIAYYLDLFYNKPIMEKLHYANKKEYQAKLKTIQQGGAKNLHVVADFDYTLTKQFSKVNKINTAPGIIQESFLVPEGYRLGKREIYEQYRPLELSQSITGQAKAKLMVEWWGRAQKLAIKYNINRRLIKKVLLQNNLELRDGCGEFIKFLEKNKVPLLIFSAGMGDVIDIALTEMGLLSNNIFLAANFMELNKKGNVAGFSRPLIHSQNKSEALVRNLPAGRELDKRDNLILLGDIPEDVGMSEGIEHECILKIGFLNEEIEQRLPEYKKHFDLIIASDGSMEVVNGILQKVL